MNSKDVSTAWNPSRWDLDLQFKSAYKNSNAIVKRRQSMLPRLVPITREECGV